MASQRVAFVGGGNMARSLIGGLIARGSEPGRLSVSEPQAALREALAREFGIRAAQDNLDAIRGADLVLLVNGSSASSSEILAAALKDYGRASIVGTQTFGKGIMQYVVGLDSGNGMQLTYCQYFTPNGETVHKVGVTPDIIVEMPEEYASKFFQPGDMTDPQLAAAQAEAARLAAEAAQ